MGSVIDNIECPNCKQEAYSDFYYKTGEEYVNCNNCGYHYSAVIKNRDKKLSELTEEDWQITELKNPYGSYRIKYYGAIGVECGSIETEQEYRVFKEEVCHMSEIEENIEFATVSKLINGAIEVETVIDNGPEVDSAGFTKEDR